MNRRPSHTSVLVIFAIFAASFVATLLLIVALVLIRGVSAPTQQQAPATEESASAPLSPTAPAAAPNVQITETQSTVFHTRTIRTVTPPPAAPTAPTPPVALPPANISNMPFIYSFNVPGILDEAESAAKSRSQYWFLDSGGKFIVENGYGGTIQGALPSSDEWRKLYAKDNPTDTDNGAHPQNIFRLVSRGTWENASTEAYFKITGDNFSASQNRNESNGLLIMTRYQDQYTLYYAGIRVDGHAVIKKKYHGTYFTLAEDPIYPGEYDRDSDVNLLPHNTWIGIRSETTTLADGTVRLRLYLKESNDASWRVVLTAHDDGSYDGTPPILASGASGIRTDFMDVLFRAFRIDTL